MSVDFEVSAEKIQTLKDKGHLVICYVRSVAAVQLNVSHKLISLEPALVFTGGRQKMPRSNLKGLEAEIITSCNRKRTMSKKNAFEDVFASLL